MKLGELVDAIRRLEGAERDLADAEQSLLHGGNAETIKAKQESVENAEWWLSEVRDQDLPEDLL